nr:hypothetical protein [Tanacetum cinerariifolium]
ICPRLSNQAFVVPLSEEELVTFIQELGYSVKCDMLSLIHTDQMHQPWRTFAAIINREISSARKEHMPYLRFTKVIINHFISKDKTISMRNMINFQTTHDDSLLGTLKFVSKTQDYQQYEALNPDDMINQDIKYSKAYKTYYDFATGKATLKKARKYKKVASPFRNLSLVLEEEPVEKPKRARKPTKKSTTLPTAGVVIIDTPRESVPKKKTPSKVDRAKGMDLLFDAALLEAAQVPDESEDKTTSTDKLTEEYDEMYKDVDVKSLDAEHEKERKGDEEMTNANKNVSQDRSNEQVVDDTHMTLTTTHKTKGSMRSSFVSSDFSSKFLNLDNVPPADNEVASIMNVKVCQEESSTLAPPLFTVPITAILKTSTVATTTVPLIIHPFSSILQMTTQTLRSYTIEFKKKAQAEKEKYIDIIEKSVKEIIKDEVKSQLPYILPKEISDFATPVIQRTINESLENVVLAKSSSQPQLTYRAATSLIEFELKILLDKLEKSKSYRAAEQHRDLCDALVKSYQLDKDLFGSYGKGYSLKRGREDKDKDEDPQAGSDQGLKKRKTSKDAEPPKGSMSKESKSSSSKGSKSQSKSSGKFAQVEEPVFETADTKMPQDQGDALVYVLHNLKIEILTQEHLVGPAFNLLKGTYKSQVELKFHCEECYKAVTDKLDWTNPKGHEFPFDLSKPLPLIKNQGRQVLPANYFFNNDLEYLKGGSLSSKYTTSTTKTKAAKYDTIEGIEDMVPSLWSLVKFGVGTLSSVQRVLHDIASSLEMDYLLKRRWSKLDRKRSCIMIKAIDYQLFERRLMMNLEKFVRGREYGNDFRLLEQII